MRPLNLLACCVVIVTVSLIALHSQSPSQANAVLFEGARLIIGDGGTQIESGAFVVQAGHITSVGRKGAVSVPAGANRVDLTGKTVMPTMVNVHVHIGYEGYSSWGAQNYTPKNVLDHLQREAFYGVGATQSVGSSPTDQSIQFQRDQDAGKFPPAARFLFMPGMAPPNGGPDAILIKATSALHVVNEVSTAQEARAAVQAMANKKIKSVKIWVDDRRGTYPKMTPDVYNAIIDEAHKHQMLVHAHALTLADQKSVVRAGADVLVHIVGNEKVDDELLALVRQKKPYWTPQLGLGDRSEVCAHDPFVDQTYPEKVIEEIRKEQVPHFGPSCESRPANAETRDEMLANNLTKMVAAGARLVLGTDAGIDARYAFGWTVHHEMARWVQLGLTPPQAIVAATQRGAELLGLKDTGTLAAGKSADFIVLDADPLENIRNTRQIVNVYLRGTMLNRDSLLAAWKAASSN
jgi:imidazolonepropionase-like amidohydrolase